LHLPNKTYDGAFYLSQQDGSLRSAEVVVPIILEHVDPRSVVDIGCGVGGWLAVFHRHGIEDICGVDGGDVKLDRLRIRPEYFRPWNLGTPFDLKRRFDLALSLEVAEHLSPQRAAGFVKDLTKLADVVVFSAAIPGQGGWHHINEQWPAYWADLFERERYSPIDCLRERIWRNPDVDSWYAQNIMFFVRNDMLTNYPGLTNGILHRPMPPLSLVHPRLFQQYIPHNVSLSTIAPELPHIVWTYLRRKAMKWLFLN